MSIARQSCGLLILLVILFFYCFHKKLSLRTTRMFFCLAMVSIGSIVLDILSIFVINNIAAIPLLAVHIVCKAYLASVLFVAFFGLLYLCSDIYKNLTTFRKAVLIYSAYAAAAVAAIFATPIKIYYDEKGVARYTYGVSVLITYLTTVMVIFAIIHQMVINRESIQKKRRKAMWLWTAVWMGAALIQFIDNKLLLVGFATALGVMIVYFSLENPETMTDKYSDLFNYTALYEYLKELYASELEFAILEVRFRFVESGMRASMDGTGVKRYIKNTLKVPGAIIFKGGGDEYVVVFEDVDFAEEGAKEIEQRFERGGTDPNPICLRPVLLFVKKPRIVKDADELFFLIRNIRDDDSRIRIGRIFPVGHETVARVLRTRGIEQTIQEALDRGSVEVFYQPIYSTRRERIVGCEALMRLKSREGMLLSPDIFLPVAEQNGTILQLGELLFTQVCSFMQRLRTQTNFGIENISVNLSAQQCCWKDMAQAYIDIMDSHKIERASINLEITEATTPEDRSNLIYNMDLLVNRGVKLTLDNFGTGNSNLDYIVDMPVSVVKFDKKLSHSYRTNMKAQHVMDAGIQMVRYMGLEVVAEGIETREQVETMKDLGIDLIQGFYFARPMPEDDFLRYIKDREVLGQTTSSGI